MEISLFEVNPFSSLLLSSNYLSEDLEGLFVGALVPATALVCKRFPSPYQVLWGAAGGTGVVQSEGHSVETLWFPTAPDRRLWQGGSWKRLQLTAIG